MGIIQGSYRGYIGLHSDYISRGYVGIIWGLYRGARGIT